MAMLFNTSSLNSATRFARQNFMPVNFRGTLRENSIVNVPHPEGTPANSTAANANDVSQSERMRQQTGNFWVDLFTGARAEGIEKGDIEETTVPITETVSGFGAWADVQRIAFLFIGIVAMFVGMWSLASPGVKDTILSAAPALRSLKSVGGKAT